MLVGPNRRRDVAKGTTHIGEGGGLAENGISSNFRVPLMGICKENINELLNKH